MVHVPAWEELQWLELSDEVDYVAAPEKAGKQLQKGDAVISLGFPLDPGQPDALNTLARHAPPDPLRGRDLGHERPEDPVGIA